MSTKLLYNCRQKVGEDMKKKRITLEDVAKYAGVSRATASLVVRESNKVSEKTRRKVLQAMDDLGYIYDHVAANMRSSQSSTVGVIITDIANPYFVELLRGIHNTLDEAGYNVFLGTTFDLEEKQNQLLSRMLGHRVGGIILCPVSDISEESIEFINSIDLPIVHAVREFRELKCDYVGIDYVRGAELAVQHLIDRGHRKIAFVGGFPQSSAWKERKKGYTNVLEREGIPINESYIVPTQISREGGSEAVHLLFQLDEPPTAIFCFNDFVAHGVTLALKEKGIEPGKDIAVVGFDNTYESSLYSPPLTTVSSFPTLIGTHAAGLLYQRLTEKPTDKKRMILQPTLVVREST